MFVVRDTFIDFPPFCILILISVVNASFKKEATQLFNLFSYFHLDSYCSACSGKQ